jgi:tetratricopeptide (TPR) repeat protein
MAGRIEQALETVAGNQQLLKQVPAASALYQAIQGNMAILKYFQGSYVESSDMLEKLFDPQRPRIYCAVNRYFLGMIYLKQERIEEGRKMLLEASEYAPQTFVAWKARELLS